ncbi:hypothetical protein JMJ35_003890 [Cladonia borealis]|uniref:PARP catalytic domain-containing protein n=1 Tax=Cladonia borealis TaxID=184061 RepID=A0AA39V335_9LECA|nr:hypothetical protein JMJ35_003890 [Cladonia borealis]
MPLFKKRRDKDDWRRNVNDTVGGRRPTDDSFPWTHLQEYTKAYIERRGGLTQEQIDDHLKDLIKTHTEPELAFAACASAMSTRSVRNLLAEGLCTSHNSYFGSSLVPSLQAIVAANKVKPEAASRSERDWAIELIEHSNGSNSDGKRLYNIVSLLTSGMAADFLLRDLAIALAHNSCQSFALHLETLRAKNQWVNAFLAVEWLSRVSAASVDPPGGFGPLRLLDSCLPMWRTWAAWRPNMNRLHFLEETAINRSDSLRDLLAIDGPDFTNNGQTSLKEGLIAQGLVPQGPGFSPRTVSWGSTRIELTSGVANEMRSILDRLSSSIDAASQGGPHYITLLAHLCTGKTIRHDLVQVLEGVDCLPQTLIRPILQIYTEAHNESTVLQASKEVWLALDNDRTRSLRESLAPYIVTCTTQYVLKKKSELYKRLERNKPWDGTEVDLITFAKGFPCTSWLWPKLDLSLRHYIHFLITCSLELMNSLGALRIYIQNALPRNGLSLISQIDAYCRSLLFPQFDIDSESIELVKALMRLFQQNTDGDRRDLALQIALCPGTKKQVSCQRISQIVGLDKDIVSAVLAIFKGHKGWVNSLFDFSRFLVTKATPELRNSWSMILYNKINSQDEQIFSQAMQTLTIERWFQWLQFIQSLFEDEMEWYSPTLLKRELHAWAQRLRPYLATLESLEHNSALPCLLRGHDASTNEKLEQILIWIKGVQGIHRRKIMDLVIADLDVSGSNAGVIEGELDTISRTTSKGIEVCIHILEACQEEFMQFAEIYLSGSLQSPDLSAADRKALIILATHCGVHVEAGGARSPDISNVDWLGGWFSHRRTLPSRDCRNISNVAANYFAGEFEQLLTEARRLENLRLSLCAVDPNSVSRLLAKLHIEVSSGFDDMLAALPMTIVDMVERVGENEVELRFPITNLSTLQKQAIAAGEVESFFVRLEFSSKGIPTKFCVHLAGADFGGIRKHTPWNVSRGDLASQQHFCHGQPSRGVYQLSRILARRLPQEIGSLEDIYSFISTSIPDMSRSCIVCGCGVAYLRRSTTCQKDSCRTTFSGADCGIVLADIIWQDPTLADLLLTLVSAAAVSGRMDLLPYCPVNDATLVASLLCQLPTVDALKKHLSSCINVYGNSFRLNKALTGYSPMPDQLSQVLIWACNANRGFLTPAVDQFRIPGFGPHQFLLANAAPELEMAFAAHMTTLYSPGGVLFHGTSLDRLHAILCQGLRVLSNTPLGLNGASQGSGIYTADEPTTSLGYARSGTYPWGSAGSGWNHSSLSKHRVMLGCEFAGRKPGRNGIHVITDPTRLMVRYIFMLDPNTTSVPQAKDVTPAMQSVFASLRSGAV